MWQNAHDAYLESRILSASPLELVKMLYQGAISAVNEARRLLEAGDIAGRARAINKAVAILLELNSALDHSQAPELSSRLAQLYGYMSRRLIEANQCQADAPLQEVQGLLVTLQEGWEGAAAAATAEPPAKAESPWAQNLPESFTPAPPQDYTPACDSHAWSF